MRLIFCVLLNSQINILKIIIIYFYVVGAEKKAALDIL
jgi:hypothetical protein